MRGEEDRSGHYFVKLARRLRSGSAHASGRRRKGNHGRGSSSSHVPLLA